MRYSFKIQFCISWKAQESRNTKEIISLLCIFIVIPEFVTQVNVALDALSKNSLTVLDDNQFVDISKKIYDTIHDIRCSVMMIRVSPLDLLLSYFRIHHHLECLEGYQQMFAFFGLMLILKSISTSKLKCFSKARSSLI